ncbi:TPA: hypothetical protein HA231_05065 [Candidatus Woesearchaeota archaeon]|nr:hypothetical protein [Candidatus Woesearchaeota archaeon]
MDTVSSRLNTVTLDLFGDVLNERRSEVVRELVEKGQKVKAVELYKEKRVSLGLGAKMECVPLGEFLDLLKLHGVDLNITQEDVEDALKVARKIL